MQYDVVVLGLGANGSSAVYHLSKTELKICGIDRFTPPHTFGSSHGQSRIIRQAYHESPMYVPLVKEAYALWNELEKTSDKQLFIKTGGLMLGAADAGVVRGAQVSAETHGIAYEYLENKNIQQRFPALKINEETVAVLEKEAGILFPEACIRANLSIAEKNGVDLLFNEKVISIKSHHNKIEIVTDKSSYHTYKLIISLGAWLGQLLPELNLPLVIERQVLYWYKNINPSLQSSLLPDALPIFIWEYQKGKTFYGFGDLGDGVKIANHHAGTPIQPDLLSQDVSAEERAAIDEIVSRYVNMEPQFHYSTVCMYTNTPDEHFILDVHPHNNNIIIGSPCSGHGFKFSSLSGKILADMALEKDIPFDTKPFRIRRFF